jgi:NaMN:DMB phosphoribosyltransferase
MVLPNLSVDEIKLRGEAIALPINRLCRQAGVTPATIYRAIGNPARDIKRRTQLRLLTTLLELEREQLRRLAALHPDLVAELAGGVRLDTAA